MTPTLLVTLLPYVIVSVPLVTAASLLLCCHVTGSDPTENHYAPDETIPPPQAMESGVAVLTIGSGSGVAAQPGGSGSGIAVRG